MIRKFLLTTMSVLCSVAVWGGDNDPIVFADANVKTLCVTNWDTDGDGELSEAEAAAVTTIGTVFQNQTEITSFNEFRYFTGVTTIDEYALSGCTNLAAIEFPSNLTTISRYGMNNCGFESLVFPDNITYIGNSAVRNCTSLSSVKVGRNTVSFGKNVFRNCTSLTSITFDGTECHFNGEDAFRDCKALTSAIITDLSAWCKSYFSYSGSNPISVTGSLLLMNSENDVSVIKNLVIPDDITAIGNYVFYGCKSLESVVIPSNVTSIGYYAFYGCSNLTSVITEATEPVAISAYVFTNRANATLYVPSGCKTAYEAADYWKEFKEIVEMPPSLNDGDVFTAKISEGIDMTFKVISESEKTCQVGNGSSAAISTSYEGNVTIPSFILGYRVVGIGYRSLRRTSITSVIISEGIETIGTEAFEQCYNLTSVDIPEGIKTIGSEAFKTCSTLETVRIPGSVMTFYSEVFKNCYKLHTVVFEDGISAVGSYMFENCSSLVNVDLPNSIYSIDWGAFIKCTSLSEIALPQTLSEIASSAFYGCTALASVDIPFGINTIESSVFCGCTGLLSIEIPDGVTSIKSSAFYGCTGLSSIKIPDGVTSVEGSAFSGCTDLLSIEFPNSLVYVGSDAFNNTKWYDNQSDGIVYIGKIAYSYKGVMPENSHIIIADGTTVISPRAFSSFTNLVEVDIPESVVSIGEGCFYSCNNLAKVRVAITTPLMVSDNTFSNQGNAYLYVPEGCVEVYSNADVWKDFLSIKQFSDPEMFSGGNGTESDPYIINTIGDMKVLAKDVNGGINYTGTYFLVASPEIDFSGHSYTAIGTESKQFGGYFDGNGVVIKNLSATNGLFGYMSKNGTITNIIIDETCIINGTSRDAAGFVGASRGTISNCINKASVTSTKYHIGGICGDNMGTIINCKNYGDISSNYDVGMVGGIAGDIDSGKILNCENYGKVTGPACWIGGIVGLVTGNKSVIDGCLNAGDVSGTNDIGCITGSSEQTAIVTNNLVTSCTITGTYSSSNFGAGAIAPSDYYATFSNNYYTKDVIVKVGTNTYDNDTPRGIWGDSGPVDVENNNGAVMVEAFATGDADGDGVVDVNDVTSTINYILNKPTARFVQRAADVDGDTSIDVNDVQGIIDRALGK